MSVNVVTHTYSVFVTPQGGTTVQIANNYAFRSEQSAVTALANRGEYGIGGVSIANFSISHSSLPPPTTVPGVTNFSGANGATISVGGELYSVENANKPYSLTNPDSQTLRFELHSYEYWCTSGYCDPYGGWERSEIQGKNIANTDTIHINYQFMLEPGQTSTAWATVLGQLWSVGGSPPFYIGLYGERMAVRLGWLTSKGSVLPVIGTATVNGQSVSYANAYYDPNPIQRGHYYTFDIIINFASGTLRVLRDGVQIVNYNGPLGFDGPSHWEYGIYRAGTTNDIQATRYRNMILTNTH
jgi:hypothetical protein